MQLLLQGMRYPLPVCRYTAVAVLTADVDTEQSTPIGIEEVAEAGVGEALDLKPQNTLEEAKSRERCMVRLPTPSSDAFQGIPRWAPIVLADCFQSQLRSSIISTKAQSTYLWFKYRMVRLRLWDYDNRYMSLVFCQHKNMGAGLRINGVGHKRNYIPRAAAIQASAAFISCWRRLPLALRC